MSIQSYVKVDTVIVCIFLSFYIGSVQIKLISFCYFHIMYKIFINILGAFWTAYYLILVVGMNLFKLATG